MKLKRYKTCLLKHLKQHFISKVLLSCIKIETVRSDTGKRAGKWFRFYKHTAAEVLHLHESSGHQQKKAKYKLSRVYLEFKLHGHNQTTAPTSH